jgi:hypothetical protein
MKRFEQLVASDEASTSKFTLDGFWDAMARDDLLANGVPALEWVDGEAPSDDEEEEDASNR